MKTSIVCTLSLALRVVFIPSEFLWCSKESMCLWTSFSPWWPQFSILDAKCELKTVWVFLPRLINDYFFCQFDLGYGFVQMSACIPLAAAALGFLRLFWQKLLNIIVSVISLTFLRSRVTAVHNAETVRILAYSDGNCKSAAVLLYTTMPFVDRVYAYGYPSPPSHGTSWWLNLIFAITWRVIIGVVNRCG